MNVRTFGWMPQRDAGGDDGAQREHADRADDAGEGHGRLRLQPVLAGRAAVRYN